MPLPDMSNPFGIAPKIFTDTRVVVGLFVDTDWLSDPPPFYTYNSEGVHTSIVIHDNSTPNTFHASVDLEHIGERLYMLDDDRGGRGEHLSLRQGQEILAYCKDLIATLRRTVAVTRNALVVTDA